MNITVYCGANLGNSPIYQQAAIRLADWIAQNGYSLVYGGSKVGLMGLIADRVLAQQGKVIGVIPEFLQQREIAHQGLSELIVVNNMAERKAKMLELGDACIALPGGAGTLEEISEVYSWARIGKNPNPCILFNEKGFYDPLKTLFENMVNAGFLSQSDFSKLLFSADLTEISEFIAHYQPPVLRTY